MTDVCDDLAARLPDRYVADVQERVVLSAEAGDVTLFGGATVRESADGDGGGEPGGGAGVAVATAAGPATLVLTLPAVAPREETFVEVREEDTGRLVTVLELLSPKNKRGDGREAYLRKRNALVLSDVHLVEIDLLRSGTRLPTREPHPPGDHFAYVSHAEERPSVRVTAWELPDPLPTVAVPLHPRDGESFVDLARLVAARYERGRYRRKLNHRRDVAPPLPPDRLAWVRERLAAAGLA